MNETKTLTISEFLRERLREDEAMAQAAIADDGGQDGGFEDAFDLLTKGRDAAGPLAVEPSFADACARMIVWNTPRRVLEDIMSKRAIVDYEVALMPPGADYWTTTVLRLLAAPYRHHPDYRGEWA